MAKSDTYKEVRTFNFSNMTIRVHIPDITTDERQRRMQRIHNAAASLLLSEEKRRKEKNHV